ncbi:SCO1664 family protein [soil metagenome]
MPNLFLELQGTDGSRDTTPAPLGEVEALEFMENAEITAASLIPWGSNYSFAVAMAGSGVTHLAVYKPRAGEAPLYDFRPGTLYKREIAAYRLSRWLGWHIVPPTIERDGPHGIGSLQLYVQPDDGIEDAESFWGARSLDNERLVLFDHISNNADRKLSHCLLDSAGKVWGIDHGLTFNESSKMRTVLWQFSGFAISAALRNDRIRLVDDEAAIAAELRPFLSGRELHAFQNRIEQLLITGCYPQLNPYRNIPYGWW